MAIGAGPVLVVALQLVDEVARLADAQLVGRLEPEAIPEQADKIDPPTGKRSLGWPSPGKPWPDGLGWAWVRCEGVRDWAVTVAPVMAGPVRTSMTSWVGAWPSGWDAREGP